MANRKKFFLIALFCISFLFIVDASAKDPISVKVSADKTMATVGDKISYRVEVNYHDPILVLADIPTHQLREFTVKSISDSSKHPEKTGKHTIIKEFVIVPYEIGERIIHPFTIEYKTSAEADAVHSLDSESIVISVSSMLGDEDVNDIRGVKDIVDIKKTMMRYLWYMGFILIGLAILALIIFIIRKIISRMRMDEEKRLSPFQYAMKQLYDLRKSKLIGEGKIGQFIDKLSDIVRAYLGKAFEFETMDLTTRELNARCTEVSVDIGVHNNLIEFLEECDLIKFAKYIPDNQRIETLCDTAKDIVEEINTTTNLNLEELEDQ
ncbi:hypothetical protein ACFL3D_02590 [Candidatus Omnitrophota bacterium]